MQLLTPERASTFFSCVEIEKTMDVSPAVVMLTCNAGTIENPCRYVVMNDPSGMYAVWPDFFTNDDNSTSNDDTND